MSVDAYVLCGQSQQYAYLGKLGAGGFSYGNRRDPGGKKVGSFIGQFLGYPKLEIVRCEDIPEGYTEIDYSEFEDDWKDSLTPEEVWALSRLPPDQRQEVFEAAGKQTHCQNLQEWHRYLESYVEGVIQQGKE